MLVAAPGRFSMMNGWPSRSDSHCPIKRAAMSVGPPGANPTRICTGREGEACPHARRDMAGTGAAPARGRKGLRGGFITSAVYRLEGCLLRLDADRLHDRPPLFDLGFLIGAQRLRRLLLARWNFKALCCEFVTHVWVAQCVHGRAVELVDDVLWRALRGK